MNITQDIVSMCIKLTKALLGFYKENIISFDAFKDNAKLKLKFIEDHIDTIQNIEDRDSTAMLLNTCKNLIYHVSENNNIQV